MDWKNFLIRTLTGAVILVVVWGGTFWNMYSYSFSFGLIVLLSGLEYERLASMFCVKRLNAPMATSIDEFCRVVFPLCSLLFFLFNVLDKAQIGEYNVWGLLPLLLVGGCIVLLFANKNSSPYPVIRFLLSFFGMCYTMIPFALSSELVFDDGGEYFGDILLIILVMIWASDVGAYIFGTLLGRHRLMERISPKKSWEGSLFGLLSVMGIAYLLSLYYKEFSLENLLIGGVVVVVFGTLGDLFESMLKRILIIKDSGNILPGHGGMLDRFDAVLFVLPVAVFCIKYFL